MYDEVSMHSVRYVRHFMVRLTRKFIIKRLTGWDECSFGKKV